MFRALGVFLNVTISSQMSAVGQLKYINDGMFLFPETGKRRRASCAQISFFESRACLRSKDDKTIV